MKKMIVEKSKIAGISYAFTKDGIELPVIDITHPLFISSIDEEKLELKDKVVRILNKKIW